MSLERICADLRARQQAQIDERERRERRALSPAIDRIMRNNRIPVVRSLEDAAEHFNGAALQKRKAVEALYMVRLIATKPGGTRAAWEVWFAKAQACRREAFAHG